MRRYRQYIDCDLVMKYIVGHPWVNDSQLAEHFSLRKVSIIALIARRIEIGQLLVSRIPYGFKQQNSYSRNPDWSGPYPRGGQVIAGPVRNEPVKQMIDADRRRASRVNFPASPLKTKAVGQTP